MKRNARRAVLFASFAVLAGAVPLAEPAAAGNVCALARVWVSGRPTPAGTCVPTPVSTHCIWTDQTVAGTGAGATLCQPV